MWRLSTQTSLWSRSRMTGASVSSLMSATMATWSPSSPMRLLLTGVLQKESVAPLVHCRDFSSTSPSSHSSTTTSSASFSSSSHHHHDQEMVGNLHRFRYVKGHDVHYSAPDSKSKAPVAVVIGWLFSKGKYVDKYAELYQQRGIDTFCILPRSKHVLRPQKAASLVKNLVKLLSTPHFEGRPIIFHTFSVGGYIYGQFLRTLMDSHDKVKIEAGAAHKHDELDHRIKSHKDVAKRIKAQIFDSPVDYQRVPQGVAFAALPINSPLNSFLRALIRNSLKIYLKIAYPFVTKHHEAASEAVHNNPITTPTLWMVSRDDFVAPIEPCEQVMEKWKKRGIKVSSVYFDLSLHVSHLRSAPDLYTRELYRFIDESVPRQ